MTPLYRYVHELVAGCNVATCKLSIAQLAEHSAVVIYADIEVSLVRFRVGRHKVHVFDKKSCFLAMEPSLFESSASGPVLHKPAHSALSRQAANHAFLACYCATGQGA